MTTTIGSLTNVPVAGDAVTVPWAQDLTKLAIHPFASLAALKAAWPTPHDGAFAYLLDSDAVCVGKAGTWRWWVYDSGWVTGNAWWLTYTAVAVGATANSRFSVSGRTATLGGTWGLTTPASSGNTVAANLPVALRPSAAMNLPSAMYGTNIAMAMRFILQPNGDCQLYWGGGGSAVGALVNVSWSLTDLVPA